MVVQARLLDKRLTALFAHLPPIARMYPFMEVQSRLPQEGLHTKTAMVIFDTAMLELMLVHAFEAEGFVITRLALIPLSEHMEVVDMLPQLYFSVEFSLAGSAVEPFIYAMFF